MEEAEEVVALLPVVATGRARAPGPHVRRGVVQIVRRDGAACGERERGIERRREGEKERDE